MSQGGSAAAKKAEEEVGWNNTGTYIGVGGVVVAGGLFYTRTIKTMTALILAILALIAGWYMQPAKDEKKTGDEE